MLEVGEVMEINKHSDLDKPGVFYKPEWLGDKTRYYCGQNGFGHWWPVMQTNCSNSAYWYPIIIRNSNPFKTLNGAIKFIEKVIQRHEVS